MAREMSTIEFPYGDLEDAINVARNIQEEGGGRCAIDQLAAWLGHDTTNSGAFRSKVSTARIFGLVDTEREGAALTELGYEILDPSRSEAAKVEAFLNVPLYKELYDRFRGKLLPPDKGLEALVDELGVSSKQTARARQAFQRSARQAGFFAHGSDRLVRPSVGNGGAGLDEPDSAPNSEESRVPEDRADGTIDTGIDASHPFIQGLFESLPKPGSDWSVEGREKWLKAAEDIFALIYPE